MEPKMINRPTILRGHHLLCVFGWRGFGYSDEFNRAMDEVVKNLDDSEIAITAGPDELCRKCPNLQKNRCYKNDGDQEEAILAHDKRVLEFLDLEIGSTITVSELKVIIRKKEAQKFLGELCLGCSWFDKGYCLEGLNAIKD